MSLHCDYSKYHLHYSLPVFGLNNYWNMRTIWLQLKRYVMIASCAYDSNTLN